MLVKNDEMTFKIKNENGEDEIFEILFTFESEETNKSYIVYTDNSFDSNGNIEVYASTYNSTGSSTELQPIETEKEWKIIEAILDTLQDEVGSNERSLKSIENENKHWISKMKSLVDSIASDQESKLLQVISEMTEKLLSKDIAEYTEELFAVLVRAQEKLNFPYKSYIDLGMKAYKQHNYVLAELAFEKGGAKNNLAYLIRRGEVKDISIYDNRQIADLLKNGVYNKEPFSMANMALFWALKIGTEDAWKLADRIMYYLPKDESFSVYNWWMDVANAGDHEGYLVHYWLLKHMKILHSPLGTEAGIRKKLSVLIQQMPSFI